MKIFRSLADVDLSSSVVTIGKFDGLHLGHQSIINRLQVLATENQAAAVVVTFDRNPITVLRPSSAEPDLTSLDLKLELLQQTGVDAVLVLEFSEQLASIPAEDFIAELSTKLCTKQYLVGPDFRFGHRGLGDYDLLTELGKKYNFQVEQVTDYNFDGRKVSSSRIRQLLADGNLAEANAMLGRPHLVRAEVVHGAKRGRKLGFPTANLDHNVAGFVPKDGVYAGFLKVDNNRYPAAISVGNNPTFRELSVSQIEAHLPGQNLDLYGKIVEVEFWHWLRGMTAFTGVPDLITSISKDVADTLAILPKN